MRFIIDAQLPPRIAIWLNEYGHDAIHTDDLPLGNKTSDITIAERSVSEDRIVITKDTDFMKMHMIKEIPELILFITTGNLRNSQLIMVFEQNTDRIVAIFANGNRIVELSDEKIIIRKSS